MGQFRSRVRRAWVRFLPDVPLPLYVKPGLWWISRHDDVSNLLFAGAFEVAERRVFAGLLKPGMTVVDVGGHAGLYSMTASKGVGPSGRVVAFEPSPRERARLLMHLRLNGCANVTVEPVALGESTGEVTLYVVQTGDTGCNSLKPGNVGKTEGVRVPLKRLDDVFANGPKVDVVKMDVEGAELSVLRGGAEMFRANRPTLLCEIEEARIAPWGYGGHEIIDLVRGWGYDWFYINPANGALEPVVATRSKFEGNFVARPQ
jgi:FkbM family methyltransferase